MWAAGKVRRPLCADAAVRGFAVDARSAPTLRSAALPWIGRSTALRRTGSERASHPPGFGLGGIFGKFLGAFWVVRDIDTC